MIDDEHNIYVIFMLNLCYIYVIHVIYVCHIL